MSNRSNITSYSDYVIRGKQIKVGNKVYQRKVGAVVAIVVGTTLQVGWSLCNNKEGDQFNPEMAMSLANGRAILQHANSVKYSKRAAPTTVELIRRGLPQSVLSVMSTLVRQAFADHPEIKAVRIFNTKTARVEATPQPVW